MVELKFKEKVSELQAKLKQCPDEEKPLIEKALEEIYDLWNELIICGALNDNKNN